MCSCKRQRECCTIIERETAFKKRGAISLQSRINLSTSVARLGLAAVSTPTAAAGSSRDTRKAKTRRYPEGKSGLWAESTTPCIFGQKAGGGYREGSIGYSKAPSESTRYHEREREGRVCRRGGAVWATAARLDLTVRRTSTLVAFGHLSWLGKGRCIPYSSIAVSRDYCCSL